MKNYDSNLMSRRSFLASIGVGAGALLVPGVAGAAEPGDSCSEEPIGPQQWQQNLSVDELWERAVAEAKADGEEITSVERGGNVVVPFARVNAVAQLLTTVSGLPESLRSIAVFDTIGSSPTRINTVYDIFLSGFQSTPTHEVYTYTKLDSGRTLAAHITASLKNYFGLTQAYAFYAEFSPSGGGWMTGKILS